MITTLPAGKYYIGDPCYIFKDSWNRVLTSTNYFEDTSGKIDGHNYCAASTAYGDGIYEDNQGRNYGVDSGVIGIISISALEIDNKTTVDNITGSDYMHVVEFDSEFTVQIADGIFQFGTIVINTN